MVRQSPPKASHLTVVSMTIHGGPLRGGCCDSVSAQRRTTSDRRTNLAHGGWIIDHAGQKPTRQWREFRTTRRPTVGVIGCGYLVKAQGKDRPVMGGFRRHMSMDRQGGGSSGIRDTYVAAVAQRATVICLLSRGSGTSEAWRKLKLFKTMNRGSPIAENWCAWMPGQSGMHSVTT